MPTLLDLEALRESIEEIDREILKKLKARMELAEKVARAKLSAAIPFRDPQREEQVLGRVRQIAVELGLDAHEIERLFRLIMEMSISRQQSHIQGLETLPLRVAYLGVEGSPHHRAAQKQYAGRSGGSLLTGYQTLWEVAEEVRSGRADVGLMPIENTRAGSENETYEVLAGGGLTITAETLGSVDYRIFALPGTSLEEIRTVLAQRDALEGWRALLRDLPGVQVQVVHDAVAGARRIQQGTDRTMAALIQEPDGRRIGLESVKSVAPSGRQYTRYVEISREATPCPPDVPCKTSLIFVLDDRPGVLREVLTRMANHQVNLTKLESRPLAGTALQYRFYMDVEGHAASQGLSAALVELQSLARDMRILGTYPRAQDSSVGSR